MPGTLSLWKQQSVQVQAVLTYLEELPPAQRELGFTVHDYLQQLVFPLDAAIKWNIPFYTHYGNLCFLNPVKEKSVVIGFMRGSELTDEAGLLTAHDRKLIRHLPLSCADDLFRPGVAELLLEAAALNEQYAKR